MDVSIIFKIVGVGILVAVSSQILAKAKNDELAFYVSLAGVIIVLFMLVGKIGDLYNTVKSVFGF